jgi:hypothetical protein
MLGTTARTAIMSNSGIRKIFRSLCVVGATAAAFGATTATADGPAAIAPADNPARASFATFSREWMEKVQRNAEEQKPTARTAASNTVVTYRDYTDDFTTELRPTGHASAPYVGILRYREQIFSCRDIAAKDCTMSSQIPVTEIFRYQNGRWIY